MYGVRPKCQRGAEVRAWFTVACVKHGVNISLPSAEAVQMLSEKKRIRAELGGGEGVNQSVTKTRSLNLRAPDIGRAAVWRGG